MLVTYERFGALTLPIYDPSEPIGAFSARGSFLDLPEGGASRGAGSGRAAASPRELTRVGTLLGASLAEVDTAFAQLVAAARTQDRLYARRPDGRIVWTMAELARVDALREPRRLFRGCPDVALDVEMAFVLFSPPWSGSRHGRGWTFDAGESFDSGLVFDEALGDIFTLTAGLATSCLLENAGNATGRDVTLIIAAGAAPITQVLVTSTSPAGVKQADFEYNGTIASNYALRIDAGAQAIELNTSGEWTGDYTNLYLRPDHALAGWLVLDAGTTDVRVTIVSLQNATLYAFYSDAWA